MDPGCYVHALWLSGKAFRVIPILAWCLEVTSSLLQSGMLWGSMGANSVPVGQWPATWRIKTTGIHAGARTTDSRKYHTRGIEEQGLVLYMEDVHISCKTSTSKAGSPKINYRLCHVPLLSFTSPFPIPLLYSLFTASVTS